MVWHRSTPGLVVEIKDDLRSRYPLLHLFIEGGTVAEVRGTFPVRSVEGHELDRYLIHITLPNDYPNELPSLREVSGRIPWIADRHMNSDGTACVMLPDDRWRCFPVGARFRQFLDEPVRDFFLGQSLVSRGEPWPFGQWSHGAQGRFEYYQWLLKTQDLVTIVRFLRVLQKLNFKTHMECPCGSGRKIRKCCTERLADLRRKIPATVAAQALKDFGVDFQSYIGSRLL